MNATVNASLPPMFDGPLHDAAARCARDVAGAPVSEPLSLMAGLGWPGLLIAEAQGGADGTLADLGSLVEPLAAAAVSLPVVEACAMAPLLLKAGRGQALADHGLGELAEGRLRVLPLIDVCAPFEASALQMQVGSDGDTRLSGQVRGLPLAERPTHWLALVRWPADALSLVLIDDAAVAAGTRFRAIDGSTTADVTIASLPVSADRIVARGEPLQRALATCQLVGQMTTGIEIAAACSALIDQTLEHLKNRRQFDAPLSSFQVLRHRVVDMYVRCVSGRNLIAQTLREPGHSLAAAQRRALLLKLSLGEIGRFCAEQAIQCHGALGLSEEVLATRLAQRILQADFRFGDRFACLQALRALDAATAVPDAPAIPLPRMLQPAGPAMPPSGPGASGP